jgi:hypothetical protein
MTMTGMLKLNTANSQQLIDGQRDDDQNSLWVTFARMRGSSHSLWVRCDQMMIRACILLQAVFLWSTTLDCIKQATASKETFPCSSSSALLLLPTQARIQQPPFPPCRADSCFGVGKNIRRADRRFSDLSPTRRQIRCFDLEFLGGISAHMQTCNGG